MRLQLVVNGRREALEVAPHELLLDVLRDRLGLTGAKRSCDVQVCGSCTVLVDGLPVSACCTLAADADGRQVLTIEGLAEQEGFARLEEAFTRRAALQCGFCTPGILLTVQALIDTGEPRSVDDVRHGLAGNLCRCTGYEAIVEAACDVAGVAP